MSLARSAVKLLAAGWDVVDRPPRGIVVLIYHRVGARTSVDVDLRTEVFEEQMAMLAADGRAVTLDAALRLLSMPEPPARDPIVVTFDDGTADVVELAVPVLERHRVPALLYLATAHIEEQRAFPDDGKPASWGALADAVSTGWLQVGSHTHSHALLDRLPADEVAGELDRSIDLIGDRLGVAAEHFAYPKALAGSPTAAAEVARRFRSAALAGTRANPYGATDPQRLARTPVQRSDGRWFLERKLAGGMGLEDRLRSVRNRRRYSGATS